LDAAMYATEELEETAKLFLLLRNSEIRPLTPDQVAELRAKFGESIAFPASPRERRSNVGHHARPIASLRLTEKPHRWIPRRR
ncbi:hypothetical protein ABTL61_19915, partial [Acinetobacter baumannii]